MEDPDIPADAGISIEFQIPLTSKRIDFIITGLNEVQQEQVVIIELKQWSSAELTDKDALVKPVSSMVSQRRHTLPIRHGHMPR